MAHNIKKGVILGKDVQELFKYAKEKGFALPAANVISSNSINAALETAVAVNAPMIIQFSNGGAQFMAGKGLLCLEQYLVLNTFTSWQKPMELLLSCTPTTVLKNYFLG